MRSGKDWAALEAKYVTGDMSLRDIARDEQVAASTITRVAKKNGWESSRASYRLSKREKTYDLLADAGAIDLARRDTQMLSIADKVFGLVEKQVPVWEQQIAEGKTPISVREFDLVAKLTRVIVGQPTSRTEDRHLGLDLHRFEGLPQHDIERWERRLRLLDAGTSEGDAESPAAGAGAE